MSSEAAEAIPGCALGATPVVAAAPVSLDFREVFARHWPRYFETFGKRMPREHIRAARAILGCRTGDLGGSLYQCDDCGDWHFAYHDCNHRNCPQCGHGKGLDWAERQKVRLLPGVPYSMVTFTIPAELRRVFRSNQRLCFRLLFKASAQAMQEAAALPRLLGASLGFTGILHTWTRQLEYHPHIHYIVAEGGLTPEGNWARCPYRGYFLPVELLSANMRSLYQKALRAEDPELYQSIPASVWDDCWVTHVDASGNGKRAVDYLSRYVTRTALSAKRILSDDGEYITFSYIDSDTGETRICKLSAFEFLRRFLQHVLPSGFKRVRYYGWLAPAARKRLARIQALLDIRPEDLSAAKASRASDESGKGHVCQNCGGELHWKGRWRWGRAPPIRQPAARPLFGAGADTASAATSASSASS